MAYERPVTFAPGRGGTEITTDGLHAMQDGVYDQAVATAAAERDEALESAVSRDEIGEPGGIAGLDDGGRLPPSYATPGRVLTGAGVPDPSAGVSGDCYLDEASGTLYGPKDDLALGSAKWGSGYPLGGESISLAAGFHAEAIPQAAAGVWGASQRTASANRCFYLRFCPTVDLTGTTVAFHVATAASNDDTVAIAVYDATLATRLASTGVVAGKLNSTGVKTVPFEFSFSAGTVYYLGFSFGSVGGTGGTITGRTSADQGAQLLFGAASPNALAGIQDSAHPPPSAPSVIWGGIAVVPLVVAREA